MKTIILSLLIILILTVNNVSAQWKKYEKNNNWIVNTLSYKIQNLLNGNSLMFRKSLNIKLNNIQKKNKNNKELYNIIEKVKRNNYLTSNKTEYTKHYNKYNIDYNKIKNTWIWWHNYERSKLWLRSYTNDNRLDDTAYEWSKYQKLNNKKMSHKRNKWDKYYDYHKIENWFTNRWIKCKVKWNTTTSESIWKFWFYCKKNQDCTDALTESLRVIFNIYMAEKNLWYPANAHYKWIMSVNISKIWLWLSLYKTDEKDYYEYYVTTHYCTEFKK